MNRDELIEKARKAKDFAYAPESEFKVGAALLTTDGETFTGCNIENVSYGLTNCAERTAIFKAISEGHKKFKAIAISSSEAPQKPIYPCGACRQVMIQFSNDLEIYVDGDDKTYKISDLLPKSFSEEQMNS